MLEVRNLVKVYKTKKADDVRALDNVSMQFNETGMVFLLGKSGSGKSTLLNVMGGLDKFDSGEIIIKGRSSKTFSESDFDSYRNTFLGFIFQEYNVMPEFTVYKNIALALELQGKSADKESVDNLLRQVDLLGYAKRKPNQLSGGQKQRIAIARALIKNPEIIMADEPTGALDSNTGKQVFDTLKKLSKTKLVIVVSHDREFAEMYADRIIEMKDGRVMSDVTKRKKPPKAISNGFKIVGNHMIHIEKNHRFSSDEAKVLNQLLATQDTDIIISANKNVNTDIKKLAKIDDSGNSEFFDNTNQNDINNKQYNGSNLKLIKSRLRYKDSFKMGASGLKSKKGRLVLTIILSAISLALFGLADTMGSFNVAKSNYESLKNLKVNTVGIERRLQMKDNDGSVSSYGAEFTKDDYNELVTKFPNHKFLPKHSLKNFYFESYGYRYTSSEYYRNICEEISAVELDSSQMSDYGLSLYPNASTGKFPSANDEVAITKLQYEYFKEHSWRDQDNDNEVKITSVNDILGKSIKIDNIIYKIVGVIDTGFNEERYELLKKNEDSISTYMSSKELETVLKYDIHGCLFFKNGLLSSEDSIRIYNNYVSVQFKNYNDEYETYTSYSYLSPDSKKVIDSGAVVLYKDGITLGVNDIIIGNNENYNNEWDTFGAGYDSYYGEGGQYYLYGADGNYYHFDTKEELITVAKTEVRKVFKGQPIKIKLQNKYDEFVDVNIVGVYFDIYNTEDPASYSYYDNRSQAVYFKNLDSMNEFMYSNAGDYSAMIVKLTGDKDKDYSLVEFMSNYRSDEGGYLIKSQVSPILEEFVDIINTLAKVFLYVGLGFAVFSSLLLMNFIAISISYKKKEIGILRALGARGSDVYGIFFNESLIITFINYILSLILTLGTVIFINNYMRSDLGFYLQLLNFGFRQIFLLAAVSLLVAVVASFLPTHKISRMKPIDAIHDRK